MIYLLFSRHSIKASMAGMIQPKMLTQIGICIPFITIPICNIILRRCAADIPTRIIVTIVVTGFMVRFLSLALTLK
jgi:hypothetical protein